MIEQRINIVGDMSPSEPYNDGGSPLFRIEVNGYGGRRGHEVTSVTSYRAPDGIEQAIQHFGERGRDTLARYLSIYFGVTATEWWHSGDAWYMTCDPADWREKVGASAGSISMAEWRAYCEGDVYGVVLEKQVPWTAPDGRVNLLWEEIDSCWGFYGLDAAKKYAAETYSGDTYPDVPVIVGG